MGVRERDAGTGGRRRRDNGFLTFDFGYLGFRSEAERWTGLPVDIGEPVPDLAVENRGVPPGMLDPAAPAWRTPLLAGGAAGLLGLAALLVRRRRAVVGVP